MNLSAIRERVTIDAVRWTPKGLYTEVVGWGARRKLPRAVRRPVYTAFARWVGARLDEVELPLDEYPSLGSFFVRRLRPGARKLGGGDSAVLAPCDGRLEAAGEVCDGTAIQAKGIAYRVEEFLGDARLARAVDGGTYATFYLSPRDYHRVHFPVGGSVVSYRFIPGALLPVSALFVDRVDGLFVGNERVVVELGTPHGPIAIVMVGAMGVGNIELTYCGEPVLSRSLRPQQEHVFVQHPRPINVSAGDELGAFRLGSTVVVFLPPGIELLEGIGGAVRWGAPFAAIEEEFSRGFGE